MRVYDVLLDEMFGSRPSVAWQDILGMFKRNPWPFRMLAREKRLRHQGDLRLTHSKGSAANRGPGACREGRGGLQPYIRGGLDGGHEAFLHRAGPRVAVWGSAAAAHVSFNGPVRALS